MATPSPRSSGAVRALRAGSGSRRDSQSALPTDTEHGQAPLPLARRHHHQAGRQPDGPLPRASGGDQPPGRKQVRRDRRSTCPSVFRRGELTGKALFTDRMREGEIFVPFVKLSESAANFLTNAAYDPDSKIPEYKVCAVRVEAVEEE